MLRSAAFRHATLVAAVATTFGVLVPATAAHADDYPSWNDVQAAKSSAQATASEVQKLAGLLQTLQAQVNSTAATELKAEAKATTAQAALDAATDTSDRLDAQAAAARKDSVEANRRFGALVTQLAESRGTNTTTQLLLSQGAASSLLHKLSGLDQVSRLNAGLRDQAEQAENRSRTLDAQAREATATRAALSDAAAQALSEAQAAEKKADAQLAAANQQSATLYAQLATLKNTAASVEAAYSRGQAEKAEEAQQARQVQSSQSSQRNGGSGGNLGLNPSAVTSDPSGAKAYANSRLASYGWGGGQFSCLVSLWTQESGWRANAYNTSSGAYGIPQSLPAGKMASAGADYRTNAQTQINWGLDYIKRAYGSPCGAWAHEGSDNWY